MDKLKEIIDQLKDALSARWDQIQETDSYISLREKYDNLPQAGQKLVVFSAFALAFLIVFSVPYGWFSTSQDSVVEFEDTKETISDLLDVSQGIKNIPPQGLGLSSSDLKLRTDKILSEKGLGKDQIASVNETQFTNPQGSNLIPPQISATGVESNLKKLTLKQIVDIGYEFEKISPLVKILNLEINATPEDPHYYNVQFRVSSFSVKEEKKQ
jgi:hypothetical protein